MTDPLVSVAIPTYNRAGYLREAVRSVLGQTFPDFELIVCDDASTDETPQVCEEFRNLDGRVRTIRHPTNRGMAENWNSGLFASRGRYFAKLDDDNRYLPTFLEKRVRALQSVPGAGFAFTDEWWIDGAGQRDSKLTELCSRRYGRTGLAAGLQRDTALLAVRQSFGINSSLFLMDPVRAVGGFQAFAGTIGDFDLFLNLAQRGHLACYVPQRLAEYRDHGAMGSSDLLDNKKKAQAHVAILQARRFRGRAERLRLRQLSCAYTSLGRVLALHGEVRAARRAIQKAWVLAPGRLRTLLGLAVLSLPAGVVQSVVQRRYRGSPGPRRSGTTSAS